jgi:hypothetical protein
MARHEIGAVNCWFVRQKEYVSRATGEYIPGKRLELTFPSDGREYTVILKAGSQGNWQGDYRDSSGSTGLVAAKLYSSEDGEMVLVGRWPEDGIEFTWLVDQIAVEDAND